MKIQHLNHNEIDFAKWDDCINRSLNGIVYAYSWYLNIVADDWDALVGDDYSIVFPLIKRRKYGIYYLFQPIFTQQLGIFSSTLVDSQITKEFIDAIPSIYKYQEINFNILNTLVNIDGEISERVTYQLDLIQPYIRLSSKYNENTRRNVSRAIAYGITIQRGKSANEFIEFYKANLKVNLKSEHYQTLQRIISTSIEKRLGEIYLAYTNDNFLCGATFFVRSNSKVIYLAAASNEKGKSQRAMFLLVDRFIHDNSENHLTLDFEGSKHEGVARFYAGFGAVRCTFKRLTRNNLPWFLRPFKK